MKKNVVGIIAEYNPFHNGHLLHLKKINEIFKTDHIKIAVVSGDFVQRGEPSIISKYQKTRICLEAGIDIVVELPAFYSTQSAEIFSKASIKILDKLSCTHLVFGSETNDLEKLKKKKKIFSEEEFSKNIKKFLKEGLSYPTAFSKAAGNFYLEPNDILALEYLKALEDIKSEIKALSIKREKVAYYSDEKKENIASASFIRKIYLEKNMSKEEKINFLKDLLPSFSFKYVQKNIENPISLENFYDEIKYKCYFSDKKLFSDEYQDMERGLGNRINKMALKNNEYLDFFSELLTKRYTISRLQRVLLHSILNIDKSLTEKIKEEIPFINILGFSEMGQKYISFLKKQENFKEKKILTSSRNLKEILSEEELFLFNLNESCSKLYNSKSRIKIYKRPIIFTKN